MFEMDDLYGELTYRDALTQHPSQLQGQYFVKHDSKPCVSSIPRPL